MLAEGQIKLQDEERPDTSSKISQTSFYLVFLLQFILRKKEKKTWFPPQQESHVAALWNF